MPIQSRCPACQAALAPSASWCSLCHADLRPAPVPRPDEPVAALPSSEEVPGMPEGLPGASLEPAPRRGRHARPDDEPAGSDASVVPTTSGGRHRRSAVALLDADDVAVPDSPEDIGVYADLMLTRLALTDPTPRLADPSRFPGGRWGLAGAATVVVTLVVLSGTALLGALLG